ncbi:MAG: branched-chain-amino-acid transaminase [Candidatus Omnitrophica bacterium CG1_02_49_16]|nr:MAG: branched-chain-amino-acid transaminase [Candidatus Omnitrophica bacterium CG1_02_49_16]
MGLKIYLDGKLVEKSEAVVSVFDHGLLYGDGVFEGIRSYDCLVFKLSEHLDRLFESARTLKLEIPLSKKALETALIDTLKANGLRDAYIRLVVTRGVGDLGLDPRKCEKATIFIIADKIALYPREYYEKGLVLATVPTVRNHPEALNPQLKTLNYLNNILAKIEATNAGVDEAILLNTQGYVTECTGENIFYVKDRWVVTPPTYVGILKGITRDAVMRLSKESGFRVEENPFTRHDLYTADEVFLTGTAAEIVSVVKIDNRMIGRGCPGKVTFQLMNEFKKLTLKEGVKYEIGGIHAVR